MRINEIITESKEIVNSILSQLTQLSYADKIVVFGSVARGSQNPGDLDVVVNANVPYSPEELKKYRALINIGHSNYGSFDPFVKFSNLLAVRNDDCTGWTKSKNSSQILANISKEGVPLLSLKTNTSALLR